MKAGKYLLSVLVLVSVGATLIADLGYLHASNESWPPHARLHAVWAVFHVVGTHSLALGLIWLGSGSIQHIRIAVLLIIAYAGSFFFSLAMAPIFAGAIAPDVPVDQMPPQPFGMDGNLFSFLVGAPLILYAWWLCERAPASAAQAAP